METFVGQKGVKKDPKNYRPISNLPSLSKVFERCVLDYIKDLEERSGIKLSGEHQHGFQKGRSTTTVGLTIQEVIANATQAGKWAIVYSLDLTAAFDLLEKLSGPHRRKGAPGKRPTTSKPSVSSKRSWS